MHRPLVSVLLRWLCCLLGLAVVGCSPVHFHSGDLPRESRDRLQHMSAEDAALVVALEAYCHEQLKITEEQRLTEKMTLGGELPPDVQAWMGQRYPGLTFLKGHYPKLSTQVWFDAAPMECQVMIERFWGPHAAVPWIFTLKQDKRQRWKVVAREMGPVA